jgi:hypothetical protein
MVKKLKGKATEELKGKEKRQRFREYEEAKQFWLKLLPFIFGTIIFIIFYSIYKIKT